MKTLRPNGQKLCLVPDVVSSTSYSLPEAEAVVIFNLNVLAAIANSKNNLIGVLGTVFAYYMISMTAYIIHTHIYIYMHASHVIYHVETSIKYTAYIGLMFMKIVVKSVGILIR